MQNSGLDTDVMGLGNLKKEVLVKATKILTQLGDAIRECN